ncbi:MAG: leucyl/phenylalanyl-tRNA--protein transferase [Burkholderiaceae bacterium]
MLPFLTDAQPFPQTAQALALPNGLLAASKTLTVERLLSAYRRGVFPWYGPGEPVLWWAPHPRMVLFTEEFKISRSLRKTVRRAAGSGHYAVRVDVDFAAVMQACAAPRGAAEGTWIQPPVMAAYCELHAQGLAHSIETWRDGVLVGGLYLVAIGRMVYGESMFARESDASKIALTCLVNWLRGQEGDLIDCQQNTHHLSSLGGREISRQLFETLLTERIDAPPFAWTACDDLLQLL